MATVKKVKKAQGGTAQYKSQWGKKTADSTKYYNDKAMDNLKAVVNLRSHGASAKDTEGYQKEQRQALKDRNRQRMKGTPGYDKNGFPVKKQKTGGKVKKAQFGTMEKKTSPGGMYKSRTFRDASGNVVKETQRRTLKGFLSGAPRAAGKKASMKKGGKIIKKAQNGADMVSKLKAANKNSKSTDRKMGLNFDKKSFDSVKSYDSLIKTKTKPKAKNGTSFGMLSVKAGVDKNPKPTAADRIAGAKGLAKYGKMMKKGGKCKNGC
jgi:hypothetical protein